MEFCLKQGRKISDICLKQGQGTRGLAAPPHPGIYRVPPPGPRQAERASGKAIERPQISAVHRFPAKISNTEHFAKTMAPSVVAESRGPIS